MVDVGHIGAIFTGWTRRLRWEEATPRRLRRRGVVGPLAVEAMGCSVVGGAWFVSRLGRVKIGRGQCCVCLFGSSGTAAIRGRHGSQAMQH